jgi:hypothetical protein
VKLVNIFTGTKNLDYLKRLIIQKEIHGFFNQENSKRKPDIWYYTKVKKGSITELDLFIINFTISWNDAIINPEQFDKSSDLSYIYAPFNSKEVEVNVLGNVRSKKIDNINRL